MKILICCLLIILGITSFAQNNLSGSRTSSVYKYIYKITNVEAIKLSHPDYEFDERLLHTLIDSITTTQDFPSLTPGNYLVTSAVENKFKYELKTIGDIAFKLVNNNRDLSIMLHTRKGEIIPGAGVFIGRKKIPFDPVSQTYRLNKSRREGKAYAIVDSVVYFFEIERPSDRWYASNRNFFRRVQNTIRRNNVFSGRYRESRSYLRFRAQHPGYGKTKNELRFRGYMVFNKPIYRPGDTLKLKAYLIKRNGKALNDNLLLRLSGPAFEPDTIITKLKPQRPGSYSHEFVISRGLDLKLDKTYEIILEEETGVRSVANAANELVRMQSATRRKIVIRNKFSFEDYELKSVNFTARSDKETHARGSTASIFMEATDENDMAIMDGRVEMLVTSSAYSAKGFALPNVFVPDTLWRHSLPLDALGETKVELPDSIFPAASFDYHVKCTFLNSSNEMRTQLINQHFRNNTHLITANQISDSLHIDYFFNGVSKPVNATIYSFNENDDTLERKSSIIPVTIPIGPFATSYEILTDSAEQTANVYRKPGMVSAIASRTKDSVFILVVNPYKLKVFYTLFAGKRVIGRGYTDSLFLAKKTRTKKNYFFSLQYIFEDKVHNENYTIPLQDKMLTINVNQPAAVYPGQTATIDLAVTDAGGKAVEGADLTAFAFTKKFTDATAPVVPYLGKLYPLRNTSMKMFSGEEPDVSESIRLNWNRWKMEMNLDTIEFYKFLHPQIIYRNQEPAEDSITQVAPFVISHGDLQPVHAIYIDERPVFFSQSEELKRYSFRVSDGYHKITMRTPQKNITMDSVFVAKGVKTFISVNADTSSKHVQVRIMPDTLLAYEKILWSKYMILIENNLPENLTYIRQGNVNYLLKNKPVNYLKNNYQLVGPLAGTYADYVVKNKYRQSFEVEGGYQYTITQGLIKQKQLPGPYAFKSQLSYNPPVYNFKDFVLTENEIDSLWRDYLDYRSATEDLFRNPDMKNATSGMLRIEVGKTATGEQPFLKNILLFRYDDPNFLRVYKGQARDLGFLREGLYRAFFLFRDDGYMMIHNINVRKDGLNNFKTGIIKVSARDNTSKVMADIIHDKERAPRQIDVDDLDRLKLTFNDKYTDTLLFDNMVSGRVIDDQGEPVAFANVFIKGTRKGTNANEHGYFTIASPKNTTLQVSSVGFEYKEVDVKQNVFISIVLKAVKSSLEEVIVVGYGVATKRSFTGAVTTLNSNSEMLTGRLPGVSISIRGSATMQNAKPLVIVNGVPFPGSVSDLDPTTLGSINVLENSVAIAIYGARAAGGVIIVTTKQAASNENNQEVAAIGSLRKNFHDDAYWQPNLVTDAKGKASFKVTFPDDITNWRTFAIAMAGKKRTGTVEGEIRSFKTLSANLSLPMFLVEGDSINAIGKVLNYMPDTVKVKRLFSFNDVMIAESEINIRNSRIDTFAVVAGSSDSVKFKYTIQKQDGYFDGEERLVPVFKPGVLETNGLFVVLQNDTTISLDFDPSNDSVKLYAEASVLPVLLDEIQTVTNYRYLCNEQLASKLKALLMQKKVYAYLKKDFAADKKIMEIIGLLNKNKSGYLWGWWINNEPMMWISSHVIEALIMAEENGFKTNLDRPRMIDYLVYNYESYLSSDKLSTLHLLQSLKANVNYKSYIDTIKSNYKFDNLYNRLLFTKIQQDAGLPVSLDSFVAKPRYTAFGNMYWGEENYTLFNNAVQNTLLIYKLLKKAGGYNSQLAKIRNYYLEKRRGGNWRNTYESTLILETILPDMIGGETAIKPSSLIISGAQKTTVTKFPFSMDLNGKEKVTVTKQGALPVYLTAFQRHWNSNPEKTDSLFNVQSVFDKSGQLINQLKAGEPVLIKVNVFVKADADYVMLEIPIPAGCSYQDKSQSYSNNEVHREYFRNKVSIFCRELKQGGYTFTVSLMPRYTGAFKLNPATAEMMYFPVFFGREAMKTVRIF